MQATKISTKRPPITGTAGLSIVQLEGYAARDRCGRWTGEASEARGEELARRGAAVANEGQGTGSGIKEGRKATHCRLAVHSPCPCSRRFGRERCLRAICAGAGRKTGRRDPRSEGVAETPIGAGNVQ